MMNLYWKITYGMRHLVPLMAMAIVAATSCAGPSAAKGPLAWGVVGSTPLNTDEQQYRKAFGIMRERGLTTYRVGVNLTADSPHSADNLAQMLVDAREFGITLKPILFVALQWKDKADAPRDPTVNRKALYNDAYARTYAIVRRFKSDITDWEMGNEINLRTRFDNGGKDIGPPAGWSAKTFDTPRMQDWASVLLGQSDAIAAVNKEFGTHIRRVLNTTILQFGFLDFMESQKVGFDVISYHYYDKLGEDMSHHWNGNNKPVNLFKALAAYHRPVVFNEVNCSEIYDASYDNVPGGHLTKECMQNLDKILTAISNQTDADIEGIQLYTLIDLPNVSTPAERRFGLMYDLDHPKLSLAIAASHAGGLVTPEERQQMNQLGIPH